MSKQTNTKYLQKNVFTRLFPSVPFPQCPTGQVCVCQCVWATVGGSVCDFFQTGDWKWGRSHYTGRITQSTPKWGAGACQHTWMCVRMCVCAFSCVCTCFCVRAGSSQWPSFNEPPMIYLLCPYPTSPCTNTHIHTDKHMISSISVIRWNLQMWLFFPTQDGTSRRKWCLVRGEQICHPISDCSSILFSPSFPCSLCPLHILALSPEPPSHPYSPILSLAALSILTCCNRPDWQL